MKTSNISNAPSTVETVGTAEHQVLVFEQLYNLVERKNPSMSKMIALDSLEQEWRNAYPDLYPEIVHPSIALLKQYGLVRTYLMQYKQWGVVRTKVYVGITQKALLRWKEYINAPQQMELDL